MPYEHGEQQPDGQGWGVGPGAPGPHGQPYHSPGHDGGQQGSQPYPQTHQYDAQQSFQPYPDQPHPDYSHGPPQAQQPYPPYEQQPYEQQQPHQQSYGPQAPAQQHTGAQPHEGAATSPEAAASGVAEDRPWTVRPGAPDYTDRQADEADVPPPLTPFQPAQEPNWASLAEERERRVRRRRRMVVGASVVGLLVVGGVVAAVSLSGGSDKPRAQGSGTPSTKGSAPFEATDPSFRPAPTVPPPPSPDQVLADPKLDTLAFTAQSLFPDGRVTVSGHTYQVVARRLDTTCTDAVDATLGPALRTARCVQLVRATLVGPGGSAATVAVAQFGSSSQAASVRGNTGALKALPGPGATKLCPPSVACLRSTNAKGRYGLMVLAGHTDGSTLKAPDPTAQKVASELNDYLSERLDARGQQTSQWIDETNRKAAEQALQG